MERIGSEPIARETLFLPRDRGGLGILVPLIQGQALRIKYLVQLAKQDNNNIWTYLGRYWVSSKIHNFTPHWQFLRSNVIPKNYDSYVPDCYSDILPLTKDNIKDILKKEATTKNIYRTIVDKHTNNYEIASEMKWNSIRQEILPWKCMWQIARTLRVHGQIQDMETFLSNNKQTQQHSENDIDKLRTHFKCPCKRQENQETSSNYPYNNTKRNMES